LPFARLGNVPYATDEQLLALAPVAYELHKLGVVADEIADEIEQWDGGPYLVVRQGNRVLFIKHSLIVMKGKGSDFTPVNLRAALEAIGRVSPKPVLAKHVDDDVMGADPKALKAAYAIALRLTALGVVAERAELFVAECSIELLMTAASRPSVACYAHSVVLFTHGARCTILDPTDADLHSACVDAGLITDSSPSSVEGAVTATDLTFTGDTTPAAAAPPSPVESAASPGACLSCNAPIRADNSLHGTCRYCVRRTGNELGGVESGSGIAEVRNVLPPRTQLYHEEV
jgi:hypothetical protein